MGLSENVGKEPGKLAPFHIRHTSMKIYHQVVARLDLGADFAKFIASHSSDPITLNRITHSPRSCQAYAGISRIVLFPYEQVKPRIAIRGSGFVNETEFLALKKPTRFGECLIHASGPLFNITRKPTAPANANGVWGIGQGARSESDRQALATFGTSAVQYATTANCTHTFAETVSIGAFSSTGLISPFHILGISCYIYFPTRKFILAEQGQTLYSSSGKTVKFLFRKGYS